MQTPPTGAPKRTTSAKPRTKSTAKSAAPKTDAPKSTLRIKSKGLSKKSVSVDVGQLDVGQMVATAAYYRAEQRGFAPGHEVEDWLAAEQEVKALVDGRLPRH